MSLVSRLSPFALLLVLLPPLAAQAPAGSRITNAGVARAQGSVDSVFLERTLRADTIDAGDFTAYLLARLGVPPFDDSLAFRVRGDSTRIRIGGRLMDFPPESRAELGALFSFLDSTSTFSAEISMPERANGVMRFRLEKVLLRGFPIPDLLVLPALAEYSRRYPVLTANGREFLVAMPPAATARLVGGGIEIRMPPPTKP